MNNQATQKNNEFVVFLKNIATGFDRFAKPYDWFYSLKNTQHIKIAVTITPGSTIEEYYNTVFLEENKDVLAGKCLVFKAKSFSLNYEIPSATTIDFDKTAQEKSLKQLQAFKANTFDSIVLPFTLNNSLDYAAVVTECARVLKTGGSILSTNLTISTPVVNNAWGFTASALKYIFGKEFTSTTQRSFGNALVGRLFLDNKKASDLVAKELNYSDLYFPVVVAIKATK